MKQRKAAELVYLLRDITWSFSSEPCIELPIHYPTEYKFKNTISVDPTPGYHCDLNVVKLLVGECEHTCPLPNSVATFILGHEKLSRTNGEASYSSQDGRIYPYIVLSGKRIPIMPAMIRYLVSHEYGHCIQYTLDKDFRCSGSDTDNLTPFEEEYFKIRGERDFVTRKANPRNWHKAASEIIANDFRSGVMLHETEFWPHDVHIPENTDIVNYWKDKLIPECKALCLQKN